MPSNRAAFRSASLIVMLIAGLIILATTAYVVDEREQAVVLQFGRPVKERTEPGLYFKVPMLQSVVVLPKTMQLWSGNPLPDLPTKDDKKIEVEPWAMWRISNPTDFVQRMRTMDNAQSRVREFTRSAMRDVITQYDLNELVRSTDREMLTSSSQVGTETSAEDTANQPTEARRVRIKIEHGRQKILQRIKSEASRRLGGATDASDPSASNGRGIELVDVGISHIEFVESVRNKTFDRWIAERKAVSDKNKFEGERMKMEIVNKASAEAERTIGEGQQRASELRGAVDAEIITQYAEAIKETGDFYTFVRTLEAYEKSIKTDTNMILTTDNEFFNLLKELPAVTE